MTEIDKLVGEFATAMLTAKQSEVRHVAACYLEEAYHLGYQDSARVSHDD